MPKSDRIFVAICLTAALIFAVAGLNRRPAVVESVPLDGPIVEGPRSPQWPAVRAAHIRKYPRCEACGTLEFVEVHHVKSFHEHPDLELEPSNLISLCRGKANHHFKIGHDPDGLGGPKPPNWSDSNPNVRRDAAEFRKNPKGFSLKSDPN